MRRFEALLGTSVEFWEIDVAGLSVLTRWGTLAKGDSNEYEMMLDSPAAALAHADREIAKQRGHGFIEITAGEPPAVAAEAPEQRDEHLRWTDGDVEHARRLARRAATIVIESTGQSPETIVYDSVDEAARAFAVLVAEARAEQLAATLRTTAWKRAHAGSTTARRIAKREPLRHSALEAQCFAARATGDPRPWAIYADWLIAQGDPIGEVAGLALGGDEAGAQATLLDAFPELRTDGELALELALEHGFARRLTIRLGRDGDAPLHELCARVLMSPALRAIDAIRCGLSHRDGQDNDWAPTLQRVIESPLGSQLRELRLDAYSSSDSELSWTPFGDLAFAWQHLPQLEHLHLKSGKGGILGELALPRLRTFIRESGGLDPAEVAAIARGAWPALDHLEIWTGDRHYGGTTTLGDLAPILAARGLPRLRHLGIANSELVTDLLAELPRSRVLAQLHSLDLSKGMGDADAAERLVANAPAYRHLAAVDLSENLFTDGEVAAMRAVLDNVVVVDQREREEDYVHDDGEVEPGERYVAVGE